MKTLQEIEIELFTCVYQWGRMNVNIRQKEFALYDSAMFKSILKEYREAVERELRTKIANERVELCKSVIAYNKEVTDVLQNTPLKSPDAPRQEKEEKTDNSSHAENYGK